MGGHSARLPSVSLMATAVAPSKGVTADPYAELAEFFDRFASEESRWKRRNSTYHRLIAQVMRFHVPEDARVLEIGSGSGDLLAALKPSVGVGVDVSQGMVDRARAEHPAAPVRARPRRGAGARRDVRLHRPLGPDAVRGRPARALPPRRRALARAHPGHRQLVQPRLAAGVRARRAPAAEAAQAASQLGRAARRREPARARGVRAGADAHEDPLPEADSVRDDVPERLRRQPAADQPARGHELDRRAPAAARPRPEERVDRVRVQERAGPHRRADRPRAGLRRADRADLRRGQLDRRHARRDPAPDRGASRSATSASSRRPARARAMPFAPASPRRSTTC